MLRMYGVMGTHKGLGYYFVLIRFGPWVRLCIIQLIDWLGVLTYKGSDKTFPTRFFVSFCVFYDIRRPNLIPAGKNRQHFNGRWSSHKAEGANKDIYDYFKLEKIPWSPWFRQTGRARYLSVTEAPHNTNFDTWMENIFVSFKPSRPRTEPRTVA